MEIHTSRRNNQLNNCQVFFFFCFMRWSCVFFVSLICVLFVCSFFYCSFFILKLPQNYIPILFSKLAEQWINYRILFYVIPSFVQFASSCFCKFLVNVNKLCMIFRSCHNHINGRCWFVSHRFICDYGAAVWSIYYTWCNKNYRWKIQIIQCRRSLACAQCKYLHLLVLCLTITKFDMHMWIFVWYEKNAMRL